MVAAQATEGKSTDVVRQTFSDDAIRDLSTFADIAALFPDGIIDGAQELGNGFSILDSDDKGQLCNVPLVLIEWRFSDGNMGEFVSILTAQLSETGDIVRRVIVNDGGTGIYQQLKEFTSRTGRSAGMVLRKGLRESKYEYEDSDGVKRPAVTYYLAV